jgi:hypothetical protein
MTMAPAITKNMSTPAKPPHARNAGMAEDHRHHRDGAQAIDVGAVRQMRDTVHRPPP